MTIIKIFFISIFSLYLQAGDIRIMPLGDSITYDDSYADANNPRPANIRHAYRNYLWYQLNNAGYQVDFVGSRIAGDAVIPSFDPDNEAYPGETTQYIGDIIYNKLVHNPTDIILLHIGTNDRWRIDASGNYMSGMVKIFNEINRYETNYNHHIKIILALIIGRRHNDFASFTNTFNTNLNNLANMRIAEGDDIVIIDMQHNAGLNYNTDFRDPAHPTDEGYNKMANAWFNALDNILPTKPSDPRMLADINGDGMDDIIGFGTKGVNVSLSNGAGFSSSSLWLNHFGYNQGWRSDTMLRKMADVNGDGLADVVGFGNNGVYVSLSDGSSFEDAQLWVNDFGYNQGWRMDKGIRVLADVNGDGMADIVGFGNKGVNVALSNGSGFNTARLWVANFGYNQGWRNTKGLRFMSDVNGDGKADIVGFGNNGVYIGLSNGSSFGNAPLWVNNFGYNQGWRNNKSLRYMADVNGDGKADIVGFGNNGVYVGLSSGHSFGNAPLWVNNFGYNQGWRNDKGIRTMSDVNSDGKADIIGFGNNGVYVGLSNGKGFGNAPLWVDSFGYNQEWRNDKHLRLMADVDGDGATDVVGFGNGGASVATSTGENFDQPSLWLNDFGYDQGWTVDFTPYQVQQ